MGLMFLNILFKGGAEEGIRARKKQLGTKGYQKMGR